ncbi:MAG: hypothetical protein EXS15_08130 [Phycisphaerales bacterium]|nr:hypothetical protein [Phycisphaerales bacterium]
MTIEQKTTPSPTAASQQRGRVDSVDFASVFPSLRLFGGGSAALRPARVALAFALLLTIVACGRLWDGFAPATSPPDGLFAGALREKQLIEAVETVRSVVVAELPAELRVQARAASLDELEGLLRRAATQSVSTPVNGSRYATLASLIEAAKPRPSFDALNEAVRQSFYGVLRGIIQCSPSVALAHMHDLVIGVPIASWRAAPWFTVFFVLVICVVGGWGGGVLCRLNAGDLSSRAWSFAHANAFIRPRLSSLVCAPIFGVTLALALWIPSWLMGVLFNVPLLDIAGGALFGIALFLSALCALVCAVVVIGAPLLAPAVACDGCDAVESIQRAGAYICARPLHLLWCFVLSTIVIALTSIVADVMATAMWVVATDAYDSASGASALESFGSVRFLEPYQSAPPLLLSTTQSISAALMDIWRTILFLLVGACALSVALACATRTYLLVRSATDGHDLTDLWEDTPANSSAG